MNVSADGLAVRFLEDLPQAVPPEQPGRAETAALPEQRLQNLNFLLQHGLITRDEYQQKRRKILEEF